MRSRPVLVALGLLIPCSCLAHDIPEANVNRSIQVVVRPSLITIDYEVSLSELTLTQDLKSLIGDLPPGGQTAWMARYGQETGPLNARGLILTVDGEPIELSYVDHESEATDEPHLTFHLKADVPPQGKLRLIDSNYASAEGTSRLAIQGVEGVTIEGDSQPIDVAKIVLKPVWQLTPAEELRSKRINVDYHSKVESRSTSPSGFPHKPPEPSRRLPWLILGVFPLVLGFTQPVSHRQSTSSLTLSLTSSLVQLGCLASIAWLLFSIGLADYAQGNAGIRQTVGFAMAGVGLWEFGHFSTITTHKPHESSVDNTIGFFSSLHTVTLMICASILGQLEFMMLAAATYWLGTASRQLVKRYWNRSDRNTNLGRINGVTLASMGAIILTA